MTELRDELKIGADEGAVDYFERAETVLERHHEETGERLSLWGTMPGERPGDVLARMKVLKEAEAIRAAERERRYEQLPSPTARTTKDASVAAQESTRRFRLKSQERDVERAASEFEAQKQRLYRSDGSKVYGEEEHRERLDKLVSGLREKVGAVAKEAAQDAEGYEREALALSYVDPATQVSASERGRLEASRAFVKEDCEAMAVPALSERVVAVRAGFDRVAKVLHARYGWMRLEALSAESDRLARAGRPVGAEAAGEIRQLSEAVSGLEEQLKDPKTAERVKALKEAAAESRRVAWAARSRLHEADGTDERARRESAERTWAAF